VDHFECELGEKREKARLWLCKYVVHKHSTQFTLTLTPTHHTHHSLDLPLFLSPMVREVLLLGEPKLRQVSIPVEDVKGSVFLSEKAQLQVGGGTEKFEGVSASLISALCRSWKKNVSS
jgi:hypothetical protein